MQLLCAALALRLPRPLGRELIAGAITPAVLGGVVAAGIAGASEPEGRVLRLVPRRLQEYMRESRIAWIMYSQFEYVAAGLAVFALAPRGQARRLLRVQRAGPDLKDVPCGPLGSLADVYLPGGASAAASFEEMLVFVPGGAWSHGYKSFYTLTSRRLATELGCAVATVGYGLYPVADGAAQVAQVEEALAWAEAGAPLPPDGEPRRRLLNAGARLSVVGHSAGGQLSAAALLGRSGGEATGAGVASIGSLALLSAPLELRRHVLHEASRGVATVSALSAAFAGDDGATYSVGDEAALVTAPGSDRADGSGRTGPSAPPPRYFDDTQPMARLSPECAVAAGGAAAVKKLPPLVALFHGVEDPVVPVSSTQRFEAALKARADSSWPSVVSEYREGCSHLDYVLELITVSDRTPPLVDFLRTVAFK
mmetsp:Transcript_23414/g.76491  ORF Transcript_23414/g.76491 Transcript_23414/m.76491 type:complete len:424 (-) Transcript_23414:81-1352(-)